MRNFNFQVLQQLGRALMLPIAVLPIAGILLRFGQPDLLNIPAIAGAGNTIFKHLPLLFAVGVALGFAKGNHGAAALASVVGFLIMNSVVTTINPDINTGVLGGIIIGMLSGALYNRFYNIKLPEYLAFFGGRRFVPIITGLVAVIIGFLFGFIWPPIQSGINAFGNWLIGSDSIGLFLYGVCNRVLLMFGLHHILNNLIWFQFGSFENAAGVISHGDIARFMAGDPTAGAFTAGFFPIMMFGLPAACLAMYRTAHTHRQKAVAGMLLSIALTAFLTGVTEPIEYSFMFLAPVLYIIHALLTGISLVAMHLLGIKLGFTFSAGFIDYLLFFKMDTHPLLLIPVGLATALLYYFLFSFFIRQFNLPTIGRDIEQKIDEDEATALKDSRARLFIVALGGRSNLSNVDACTTRLRLQVNDAEKIDKIKLQHLGAKGILTPDKKTVQVILGPEADLIAGEINEACALMENKQPADTVSILETTSDSKTTSIKDIDKILAALGGANNIKTLALESLTRLRVEFSNAALMNQKTLSHFGVVAVIDLHDNIKQLLVPENTEALYRALSKKIN